MEYSSLREIHQRRKNKAAAPIGVLVLVLAACGLVALIILGVNMTSRILDNSGEKEKFEKIVQPVLMFDPPTFEDPATLDKYTVLESMLWATMLGDKRETYTFDAQSNLIVPASDVDVTASQLLGPTMELEHQTFYSDFFSISYDYDEATKAYMVPVMSATALYTPRVDEIQREGDVYSLLVGYIPPGTAWNTDLAGKKTEPDPHKYMIYKLKKVDKHYQLIAIQDPPPEKQISYMTSSVSPDQIASVDEGGGPLEPAEDEALESGVPGEAGAVGAAEESGGQGEDASPEDAGSGEGESTPSPEE